MQALLITAPTGKAAFNIAGMTLHSALMWPVNQQKGEMALGLLPPDAAANWQDLAVSDGWIERAEQLKKAASRREEFPDCYISGTGAVPPLGSRIHCIPTFKSACPSTHEGIARLREARQTLMGLSEYDSLSWWLSLGADISWLPKEALEKPSKPYFWSLKSKYGGEHNVLRMW